MRRFCMRQARRRENLLRMRGPDFQGHFCTPQKRSGNKLYTCQEWIFCNVSAKMEHAGIAHGTTVGLSVPILPRLLHKHLLLRVTRPGQPCFLMRSRTATSSLFHFRVGSCPSSNGQILTLVHLSAGIFHFKFQRVYQMTAFGSTLLWQFMTHLVLAVF